MIKKKLKDIFSKNEILTEEYFYRFSEKKKIITYVPGEYADKLMKEMSKAGAGKIGNYEMCSFRIPGTGTYIPGEKARPFKGNKNKISYEEEVRFEMECETCKHNKVLDVMLKHHPYEEAAYEVYSFLKREKEPSGIVISLKKKISHPDLIQKLNKKINYSKKNNESTDEISFDKIAFTNITADENLIKSAKIFECGFLITGSKNKYNLYKLS